MFILEQLAKWAETDRTAIVYGQQSLSFSQLEARSNTFAAFLRSRCPGDKTPVLLYGHKDLALPACMFGALKAGHAYVPIDTTFPPDRVRQIAEELQVQVVVDLAGAGVTAPFVLDQAALDNIFAQPASACSDTWVGMEDICYILFTSGSTGRPKGVQICRKNIEAFDVGVQPWFQYDEDPGVFLNEISYSFDVSVCALYYALGRGKTLYTLDKATLSDPKALFAALAEANADLWVSTPSLAELCVQSERFCEALLPKVTKFVFCGEVLTKKLSAQMLARFPHAQLLNAYGPTEATVLVTAAVITQADLDLDLPVPIGYAFSNLQARLLDADGKAVADGENGELTIFGDCVSPGYLNRPDLNASRFLTDETGLRGYRTGDLCMRRDGLIYYFGRLDSQVKLNGFRVELEDVEKNLDRVQNVARSAVLPVYQDGAVVALTACVLLEQPDGLKNLQRAKRIKDELAQYLPVYMVPRKIVAVDAFPLNTNGKIDKKALAAMLEGGAL